MYYSHNIYIKVLLMNILDNINHINHIINEKDIEKDYKVLDISSFSIEELKWDIYKKMSKVLSPIYWKPKTLFRIMYKWKNNSRILNVWNENVWVINYSKYVLGSIVWVWKTENGFIHRSSKFLFKWYERNWYWYLLEKIFFEEIKDRWVDWIRFSITPNLDNSSLEFVQKLWAKKIYEEFIYKRNIFEYYMFYDLNNVLSRDIKNIFINQDELNNLKNNKQKFLLWWKSKFYNVKIWDEIIINNEESFFVKNIVYYWNKISNLDFAFDNLLSTKKDLFDKLGLFNIELVKEYFKIKEKTIRKWVLLFEIEKI